MTASAGDATVASLIVVALFYLNGEINGVKAVGCVALYIPTFLYKQGEHLRL